MAEVVLDEVGKVYADGTRAVENLSLHVGDGEFVVLVGPSGCGKTTALRMIAGLEEATAGTIRIGERVVNRIPPRDRDVAMVFQSYALYPHLNVFDNIAFGLRLRKVPKEEIQQRVSAAAEALGLTEHLQRRPGALSGGQRQRVAMGRAIVREPMAFLMDEPLSNLDAKLRVQMRGEIIRITRRVGVTTVYVTHDQVEAMTLGDRVAVMKRGLLQQVAPPQALYDRPKNLFVAGFIGSPPMNLVEASVSLTDGGAGIVLGGQRLDLADELVRARPNVRAYDGATVAVGIRPEDLYDPALRDDRRGDLPMLTATVELTEALGSDLIVHLSLDAVPARTDDTAELARDVGDDSGESSRSALVARLNPRSSIREGEAVRVSVDTARIHLFDLNTGVAIW